MVLNDWTAMEMMSKSIIALTAAALDDRLYISYAPEASLMEVLDFFKESHV